jgi:hypothetical protein
VNKLTIIAIISAASVVMLCVGIDIIVIPPMIFEAFYSYSSDNEVLIEVMDSQLIMSVLPTLASILLILGLIGLGVHSLWKNKLSSLINNH